MTRDETHSAFYIHDPKSWIMYVSHGTCKRLVVFVHGFGGKATSTWDDFRSSGNVSSWWRDADLLFIGYDSTKDNITAVANRIRRNFPRFYPTPFQPAMVVGGVQARDDIIAPYTELIILGHSLGGLVARRVMADAAEAWIQDEDKSSVRPAVLDARLRLFSPASAGFRAAGLLGLLKASPFWPAVNMYLRESSAYTDLQPGSITLVDTRRRTEKLAVISSDMCALRAQIIWANPDEVVIAERYDTDRVDESVDGTSHISICKPDAQYSAPWRFAETGSAYA